MADSAIAWTERVWNPTVGCTKISAGCKYCYADSTPTATGNTRVTARAGGDEKDPRTRHPTLYREVSDG